jgi:hypothetical protein
MGCVNKVQHIELKPPRLKSTPLQLACSKSIRLIDERTSQELSNTRNVVLIADGSMKWLATTLKGQVEKGQLSFVQPDDKSSQVDATITIKRLSVDFQGSAIAGQVLLAWSQPNADIIYARGVDTEYNLGDSHGEIRSVLNNSLNQSLEKLAPVLSTCPNSASAKSS